MRPRSARRDTAAPMVLLADEPAGTSAPASSTRSRRCSSRCGGIGPEEWLKFSCPSRAGGAPGAIDGVMDDDELIAVLAGGDDRASTWAGATRGPGPSAPPGGPRCLDLRTPGVRGRPGRRDLPGARVSLAGNG